ncbi:hydroxyectoine utilization dehydratase EutB [Litorilinea aerophila]|uniref:threonine ammonia-lyase n=1 Tax=Litorilinea aerophila TaxID=1204385 RepID=A0A540VB27_9CHLR|nr:hydroxyectoine utilization dehydratase EutB [Litorilinea aerophila]MCC9078242.1 hydroxyectoine utilization dehydratase EutB [Litorilinea aerophila]OUC06639.1 threonine dehydratase [Litorilinea aerophila]
MRASPITLQDIYLARQRIAPHTRRTPLVYSSALSQGESQIYLKLETVQPTGSFKIRGAANRLLQPDAAAGVVTVSTGNHGRAVAHMARRLGLRAVVCVPEQVLPHKVAAMRELGAQVVVHGQSQEEAEAHAADLAQAEGLTLVSPFDDPWVIAGQGTIGLELLEELPQVDTAVIPLSGGGLLGGIALALKAANPAIRMVGVSMERGPVMVRSLEAGHPVQLPEEPTLADSLMGGIGLENRYTFRLVQALMDEVVLLSEQEIADAMVHGLRAEHLVVEGGGAVAMGAVLHRKIARPGRHVAVVVSGGNVDPDLLGRLLTGDPR